MALHGYYYRGLGGCRWSRRCKCSYLTSFVDSFIEVCSANRMERTYAGAQRHNQEKKTKRFFGLYGKLLLRISPLSLDRSIDPGVQSLLPHGQVSRYFCSTLYRGFCNKDLSLQGIGRLIDWLIDFIHVTGMKGHFFAACFDCIFLFGHIFILFHIFVHENHFRSLVIFILDWLIDYWKSKVRKARQSNVSQLIYGMASTPNTQPTRVVFPDHVDALLRFFSWPSLVLAWELWELWLRRKVQRNCFLFTNPSDAEHCYYRRVDMSCYYTMADWTKTAVFLSAGNDRLCRRGSAEKGEKMTG